MAYHDEKQLGVNYMYIEVFTHDKYCKKRKKLALILHMFLVLFCFFYFSTNNNLDFFETNTTSCGIKSGGVVGG